MNGILLTPVRTQLEVNSTILFTEIAQITFLFLGEESNSKFFIIKSDTIDGRGGIMDEVSYRESYYGINAALNDTVNSVIIYAIQEVDSIVNFEWIIGSNYSDVIVGNSADNRIRAYEGI